MIHGHRSLSGFHPVHAIGTADVPVPTSAIARFYHTFRKWEYSLAGLWHPNSLIDTNLKIGTFVHSGAIGAIGFRHRGFRQAFASACAARIDSFESVGYDFPVNGKSTQSDCTTVRFNETSANRMEEGSHQDRRQAGSEPRHRSPFGANTTIGMEAATFDVFDR
jgi:hypothetical protein